MTPVIGFAMFVFDGEFESRTECGTGGDYTDGREYAVLLDGDRSAEGLAETHGCGCCWNVRVHVLM